MSREVAPRLQHYFLGPLQVTLDGKPLTGFATDKVRALLAYLAVERDQPHRRDALAGLLWPDHPEADALANLRQTLHRLRRALAPGGQQGSSDLLLVTSQTVQIDPRHGYSVDTTDFTALLDACRQHRHRRIERCAVCHARLSHAAELYRGDFLEGFFLDGCLAFEEWLLLEREGLRRQAIEAFGYLAGYHEAQEEWEPALRYAYRQLDLEPWLEEAHRGAMRLLAVAGRRSEALAQYENCRRVLLDELGTEPEEETTALYTSIQDGSFDEQATDVGAGISGSVTTQWFYPARVSAAHRPSHNVPTQLTSFVGRESELALITERLAEPECRLLTLVGPGGAGKTRLSMHAAVAHARAFRDGACFVPLAPVPTPEAIVPAIARALDLSFQGQEDPKTQLVNHLRDRETLLVLDNFEHLLDGVDLLVELLREAPRITAMVTSRERLGLQAEHLLDISGLSSYAAPQLFLERARMSRAGFELSEETAPGVARICGLLGGMPLAIELAAASVRDYSCAEIAASIERNLDFLQVHWRDVPEQHRSLRAVFNHSWDLLSAEEQRLFRKLSVFRGGWTQEAAEAVADATLSAVAALADKSLLADAPEGRFDMHELLRQYALERLRDDPGEWAETHAAHARFHLALAEEAEEELRGPGRNRWLQRLDREHNNLRAALGWAKETAGGDNIEIAVRLAGAMWRYWYYRGYFEEGLEQLSSVLQAQGQIGEDRSTPARARALYAAGTLSISLGSADYAAAVTYFEESLALFRQLGDGRNAGSALHGLALVAHSQGDYPTAKALYTQNAQVQRETGNKQGLFLALNNLGSVARELGDYVAARTLVEEAVTIAREIDDEASIALSLLSLGALAYEGEDFLTAWKTFQESLRLYVALEDKLKIANCLDLLARVAGAQGRAEDAARLWGAVQTLRETIGATLTDADQVDYERRVAATRDLTVDAQAFAAAWGEGRVMPLSKAISLALEEG